MENDIVVVSKTFHLWSIILNRLLGIWFHMVKFRLLRCWSLFLVFFSWIAEVCLSAIFRWNFYMKRQILIVDIPLHVIKLYGANGEVFYAIGVPVSWNQPSRQLKAVFSWRKSVPLIVKVVFKVFLKLVVFIFNEVIELHNSVAYYENDRQNTWERAEQSFILISTAW